MVIHHIVPFYISMEKHCLYEYKGNTIYNVLKYIQIMYVNDNWLRSKGRSESYVSARSIVQEDCFNLYYNAW